MAALVVGGRLSTGPAVFSADARHVFTYARAIHVHDARSGELLRTLRPPAPSAEVTGVAVSRANPLQLLSVARDATLRVWDWTDGSLLRTLPLPSPALGVRTLPFAPAAAAILLQNALCVVADVATGAGKARIVAEGLNGASAFALSGDGAHAAVIARNRLHIVDLSNVADANDDDNEDSCVCRQHRFFATATLTAVAFHPHGDFVATGDAVGRILLWRSWRAVVPRSNATAAASSSTAQVVLPAWKKGVSAARKGGRIRAMKLGKRPVVDVSREMRRKREREFREQMTGLVWSQLHWHAHGVSCLCMLPDGSHLVSGGEESVLVLWNLATHARRFVPRIGAPVVGVATSLTGASLAVSLLNNTVVVLDTLSATARCVIRGMLHMHDSAPSPKAAALVADPRAPGRVVLPGVPNSLQFFDVRADRLVSELEVAPPNAVRRSMKSELLPVALVEHACFTRDGEWLITVDVRKAATSSGRPECHLKFWRWDASSQQYTLVTRVDGPHETRVTALACHPTRRLAITTSTDSRFKTWSLSKQQQQQQSWRCRSVGYYRGLPCTCAAFSPDGSLLALGCGSVLSLWDPLLSSLQFSLSHSPDGSDHKITRAMFLCGCPLVVALTSDTVLVWDLVSRSLWWSYRGTPLFAAADPLSSLFAVVVVSSTKAQLLLVFDGRDPRPRMSLRLLVDAVSLTFVPNRDGSASSLVYLNAKNELVVVEERSKEESAADSTQMEDDGEEEEEEVEAEEPILQSAFSGVVTKQKRRQVLAAIATDSSKEHALASLLDGPVHTLPALNRVLPSLFERLLPQRIVEDGSAEASTTAEMEDEEEEKEKESVEVDVDVDEDVPECLENAEVDDTTDEWVVAESGKKELFTFARSQYSELLGRALPPTAAAATASVASQKSPKKATALKRRASTKKK